MKKYVYSSFLLLAILNLSCAQREGAIEAEAFQKVIADQEELQLVDVRTLNEFNDGHIEGALHIDYYKEQFKSELQKLDKNKPIAVYCAVGGRSGATMSVLKELGFKKAYDLQGGITAWREKGYSLVKD
jgi:rhodanese-related sulfurtransferase